MMTKMFILFAQCMCTYTNNKTDNLKLIPASTVVEIRTRLGEMSQCILCNTQEKNVVLVEYDYDVNTIESSLKGPVSMCHSSNSAFQRRFNSACFKFKQHISPVLHTACVCCDGDVYAVHTMSYFKYVRK